MASKGLLYFLSDSEIICNGYLNSAVISLCVESKHRLDATLAASINHLLLATFWAYTYFFVFDFQICLEISDAYAQCGTLFTWTPTSLLWHFLITMTSPWARWRLKSPASPLFTQPFIRAQIKENIKAPRHWHLVTGEFLAQMASNAENISIWWRHHV